MYNVVQVCFKNKDGSKEEYGLVFDHVYNIKHWRSQLACNSPRPEDVVSMSVLIEELKKKANGRPLMITEYDVEAQLYRNLWIDENGFITKFSDDYDSWLMEYARAASLLQEGGRLVPLEIKRYTTPLSNCTRIGITGISYLVGGGAAVKAYTGTSGFFKDYIDSPFVVTLLGVFASLPSIAFYSDSLDRILKRTLQDFATVCARRKPAFRTIQLAMPLVLKRAFPTLEVKGTFFQKLADFVLGTGYGSANLGMVLEAFPDELDDPTLKPILLFCITLTNLTVGIDKSNKVTGDAIDFARNWRYPDNDIFSIKIDMLQAAYARYKKMLTPRSTSQSLLSSMNDLSREIGQCKTIDEAIDLLYSKVDVLQSKIDGEIRKTERAPLLDGDVEAGLDAHAQPFYARHAFTSSRPRLNKGLSAASMTTSAAAVMSNVGGIAALLANPPIGWTSLIAQLLVGSFGSLSAYGLNKKVTDDWKNKFISHFSATLTVSINERKKQCRDYVPTKSEVVGFIWSALAASANVFYTKQALDRFLKFEGFFKSLIEGYCVASVAIMVTATKRKATVNLLERIVKKCSRDTAKVLNKYRLQEDLVAMQEEQINILMKGLIKLVENFNRLIADLSPALQNKLGISKQDYDEYETKLQAKLANLDRASVLNILRKEVDEMSIPYTACYYAEPISSYKKFAEAKQFKR